MESLWSKETELPSFEKLQGDSKTDVLIIGGGMCGILCAQLLQQAGVNYMLVEAAELCSGTTKNTTAKITSQHGLLYHKLLQKLGTERAAQYLNSNESARKRLKALCQQTDCDFEEKDSFVYSMNDRAAIEHELAALERIGYHAKFSDCPELPFSVAGAVEFQHQAQFHPLKFVRGIVPKLRIYEHTKVRELVGTTAIVENGTIQAQKIIVTTHFPFLNKHGSYFLKLYQHRSYVLSLEHARDVHGMYVDESRKGLSFRNAGSELLLGGGAHRTGKNGGNWAELRRFAKRYYPNAHETAHWAAQDCMSLDDIPYIGSYSKSTEGLYVATGFNKWGMTTSMAAAMLLTDLIQNISNPYAELFAPSRSMLHPQLACNAWEATIHLLTPTTKRCPHLGCALKWNRAEHSWDCACHGSRFSEDGTLIDNPAAGDLKK